MKNVLKQSAKYAFSIVPLVAIVIFAYFKKSPIGFTPPASRPNAMAVFPGKEFADLPCGFVSHGKQQAEKPTFVTNPYIPILQYPTGNFPGTDVKIFNSIFSEHQSDDLELQVDGNLVLYCLTCNPKKPLWSSQTNGKDGKTLFFQPDGDLVLRNSLGKTIWHYNIHSTCPGSDKAYFTLQDDGNLAMLYDDAEAGLTHYLGGTGSTNDQAKMTHPGKIQ